MIAVNWFLWLIIYSFFGWVYESIVCSVGKRKFVNRGFLNGPVCPIYGFGALVSILVLYGRTENILILFLIGTFLTCTLEYLTGFLLEKIFNAKWWDYSNRRFNIHGRVCLLGAVVFGTLSVILVKYVHPFIVSVLDHFSDGIKIFAAVILFIVIAIDLYFTVRYLFRWKGRLEEIQEAINVFKSTYAVRAEKLKESLHDQFEESEFYNEHIKKLVKRNPFQDSRIAKAFPGLYPLKNNTAWQKIKSTILGRNKKK